MRKKSGVGTSPRRRSLRPIFYEGVAYYAYRVSYVTEDGRQHTKVHRAPGDAFIGETIDRWVRDAEVPIKAGSNVYVKRL